MIIADPSSDPTFMPKIRYRNCTAMMHSRIQCRTTSTVIECIEFPSLFKRLASAMEIQKYRTHFLHAKLRCFHAIENTPWKYIARTIKDLTQYRIAELIELIKLPVKGLAQSSQDNNFLRWSQREWQYSKDNWMREELTSREICNEEPTKHFVSF